MPFLKYALLKNAIICNLLYPSLLSEGRGKKVLTHKALEVTKQAIGTYMILKHFIKANSVQSTVTDERGTARKKNQYYPVFGEQIFKGRRQ